MYKKIFLMRALSVIFLNILIFGNISAKKVAPNLVEKLPFNIISSTAVEVQLINTSALDHLSFVINCIGVHISKQKQSVNDSITQVTINDLDRFMDKINISLNNGHTVKIVYATNPIGKIFKRDGVGYLCSGCLLHKTYEVSDYQLICVIYDESDKTILGQFSSSQKYVNWYNQAESLKGYTNVGNKRFTKNNAYSITISYVDGNGVSKTLTRSINQPPSGSVQGNPSVPQVIEIKPGIVPIKNVGFGGIGGISYQNVGGTQKNVNTWN